MRREDEDPLTVRRLEHDVVEAWIVPLPAQAGNGGAADAGLSMLDDDEREAASRFVQASDRARYVVSHVSVRRILAAHLGVHPSEVRIGRTGAGKPRLEPAHESDVRFNVSHGGRLALVGVARGRDVGVDVEGTTGVAWDDALAARCLGPVFAARLAALPADERATEFLRIWTRSEAVLKARGTGLETLPFPDDVLEARGMRVVELVPDRDHVAAVAGEGEWRLEVRRLSR